MDSYVNEIIARLTQVSKGAVKLHCGQILTRIINIALWSKFLAVETMHHSAH